MTTDMRDRLARIAERAELSTIERHPREIIIRDLRAAADSQTDVPVLVEIINAALNALDNYETPDKREDVTGDICSGMERLEREVLAAMEAAAECPSKSDPNPNQVEWVEAFHGALLTGDRVRFRHPRKKKKWITGRITGFNGNGVAVGPWSIRIGQTPFYVPKGEPGDAKLFAENGPWHHADTAVISP